MPLTSQSVVVSGVGPTAEVSQVLITYDSNQLGPPYNGNQNIVPGFMYLMGNVVITKDSQGNMHAVNPNKDGSIPV